MLILQETNSREWSHSGCQKTTARLPCAELFSVPNGRLAHSVGILLRAKKKRHPSSFSIATPSTGWKSRSRSFSKSWPQKKLPEVLLGFQITAPGFETRHQLDRNKDNQKRDDSQNRTPIIGQRKCDGIFVQLAAVCEKPNAVDPKERNERQQPESLEVLIMLQDLGIVDVKTKTTIAA
jgi:hypothetical protein